MSKETILILDKEDYIQWTLKTLLESEEYIVIAVNTIERALKNFMEFKVSALITEYRIGQDCTLQIIREFKMMFPEAYVMILTNNEVIEKEYEEIMNAGVDDFFLKPFWATKILLHLRKGLKQRGIYLHKNQVEKELNQIKKEEISQNIYSRPG